MNTQPQLNKSRGRLTSTRSEPPSGVQRVDSNTTILAGRNVAVLHDLPKIIPHLTPHVNTVKSHPQWVSNLIDCCLNAEDELSYQVLPDPAKLAAVRALRHQAEKVVFEGGAVLDLPNLPPPPLNPLSPTQEAALVCIVQRLGLRAYRLLKVECGVPVETPITRLSRQQAWILINHVTRENQP